jgi:hypothetical protein
VLRKARGAWGQEHKGKNMNREDIIQEMIRSEERYKQSLADLKAFEFKMAVMMIIGGSFMLGGSISFLLYKVMQ